MFKKTVVASIGLVLLGGGFAAQVTASEVTYRQSVKAVWEAQCAACHGQSSPSLPKFNENSGPYEEKNIGPSMQGYIGLTAFVVWPETGALMRRLDDGSNTPDGEPGNMYVYLGATEEERQANLKVFVDWVGGADAWFLNRWNARGDVPGVTKEQIDRLELAY